MKKLPLVNMAVALLAAASSAAAASFGVTVNTSNLTTGPFAIQFQLTNGNATGVNTVTIDNFNFGGGAASGVPTTSGGASGNLGSTVTMLDDSGFLALFTQNFTPGSQLTFNLTYSENFTGGAPDFFGMAILINGTPAPTAQGADQLIALALDATPTLEGWATTSGQSIPAPTFGAPFSTNGEVPEPSTYLTALVPLAILLGRRKAA